MLLTSFNTTFMKSGARRFLTSGLIGFLTVTMITSPSKAQADSTREFMMSAAYGALAGTLVGAASLAFSDRPGDNLNKVARGASIGLYVGILLGLYVVYGGPSEDSDAAEQLKRQTSMNVLPREPSLMVAPIVGDRGFEGAQASYSVLHF